MPEEPAPQAKPEEPSSQSPASRRLKSDAAQLLRELEAFKIDLAFLERREGQQDASSSWAIAAREHLSEVDLALAGKDVEGARRGLQRARRYAVLGFNQEELAARAQVLREEAARNSSWRTVAMQRLLAVSDDKLTAARVADAMGLRDDDAIDEKETGHRILRQIGGLLVMCILGAALTTSLPAAGLVQELAPAVLVAMMGAAISAAQVLSQRKRGSAVPNLNSVLLTVALGSAAGLAPAPLCDYVKTTLNLGPLPAWLPMVAALVLGYATQRFLVRFTVESRDLAIR